VQVLKYLEEYVLPQGVHAIPLQGLEWLTTCVDCLNSGSVTISNSKTDYVLLTDKGFQTLQDLKKGGNKGKFGDGITTNMMKLLIPEIIALFETKTTKSLSSGKSEGPVHQAVLEHLAVNSLARRSGGLARFVLYQCCMFLLTVNVCLPQQTFLFSWAT